MTSPLVLKAARHWGFDPAHVHLVAERENRVFKVERDGTPYALRMHRRGYSDADQLWSEMCLCQYLADHIAVPRPLMTENDQLFVQIDGIFFTALDWIEGKTLAAHDKPCFQSLGRTMAAFHSAVDDWDAPDTFAPRQWTPEAFLGERPIWGRFWEHPDLSHTQKMVLERARRIAKDALSACPPSDYGVIHADANLDNVMAGEGGLVLIDFDDFGYGYRLFDLAVVLQKQMFDKKAGDVTQALLQGYREKREIDTASLGTFILIRTLSFVGWIMSRTALPDAPEKSRRFIENALEVAEAYKENPKRLGYLVLD